FKHLAVYLMRQTAESILPPSSLTLPPSSLLYPFFNLMLEFRGLILLYSIGQGTRPATSACQSELPYSPFL
ncbi:MAG TPA: hypothetical protein VF544_00770, partial [Pyrinomonadaceae bacterium]